MASNSTEPWTPFNRATSGYTGDTWEISLGKSTCGGLGGSLSRTSSGAIGLAITGSGKANIGTVAVDVLAGRNEPGSISSPGTRRSPLTVATGSNEIPVLSDTG